MSRPALALVVLLTWGCESASASASGSASAANHPASGATSAAAQLDKLRVLEHRRSAAEIGESLLSHRDHDVRRAVARTLARIAAPRANAKLLDTLVAINDELQVPTPAGFGIDRDRFFEVRHTMAEQALASGSPGNNPRVPEAEEIVRLYEALW